jgi:hypothetical protein
VEVPLYITAAAYSFLIKTEIARSFYFIDNEINPKMSLDFFALRADD